MYLGNTGSETSGCIFLMCNPKNGLNYTQDLNVVANESMSQKIKGDIKSHFIQINLSYYQNRIKSCVL